MKRKQKRILNGSKKFVLKRNEGGVATKKQKHIQQIKNKLKQTA